MKEFKLLITGGTNFTDMKIFAGVIETMSETLPKNSEISFVCSMAPGADAMAYMYAHQHGIKCHEFYPNRKNGIGAKITMQAEMADFADGALLFCAPEEDMGHMVAFLQSQDKRVAVVHYST